MTTKLRLFLGAAVAALSLDVLSKTWISREIALGDRRPVIEGLFELTHVRNPGAAFSMFASAPEQFRRWFFVLAAFLALAMIVSFFRSLAPRDRLSALALGCILGGASGNLLDRVRFGEVVDFLHVRLWGGRTWPDFNLADSFIVIGVALLVVELFASESEGLESPPGSTAAS
jgi:signal peptidase II